MKVYMRKGYKTIIHRIHNNVTTWNSNMRSRALAQLFRAVRGPDRVGEERDLSPEDAPADLARAVLRSGDREYPWSA